MHIPLTNYETYLDREALSLRKSTLWACPRDEFITSGIDNYKIVLDIDKELLLNVLKAGKMD